MIYSILSNNPTCLKEFTIFLLSIKIPSESIPNILKGNILSSLGYYLKFFATKNIYIITGHKYFVIYKLEENNKQTIIECLEVLKDIDTIYICAVAKTIEYIEKPF